MCGSLLFWNGMINKMSKKFYVIEIDLIEYVYESNEVKECSMGRGYYVSSASKSVDRTDIRYAKLFPTLRSAKQAWAQADQNPKYYEVEIDVKIVQEVKI